MFVVINSSNGEVIDYYNAEHEARERVEKRAFNETDEYQIAKVIATNVSKREWE